MVVDGCQSDLEKHVDHEFQPGPRIGHSSSSLGIAANENMFLTPIEKLSGVLPVCECAKLCLPPAQRQARKVTMIDYPVTTLEIAGQPL
jgi:hypothetical protein